MTSINENPINNPKVPPTDPITPVTSWNIMKPKIARNYIIRREKQKN